MAFNLFRRKPNSPTGDTLLKAITVLATASTQEARRNFYRALLNSTLLLAQEGVGSRPVLFADEAGSVVLPVFTDLERLRKVCLDVRGYSALPACDIFRLALKNNIHCVNINPEYGPGGYLEHHELEALANGEIPDLPTVAEPSLGEPTLIPMGDPKLPTQEVLDKMQATARSLLARETSVDEGYLILTGSNDGNSQLTIALRFRTAASEDDKAGFSRRFVPSIEDVIGQPLKLLWLEGERYKAVQSVVEPFYRRGITS